MPIGGADNADSGTERAVKGSDNADRGTVSLTDTADRGTESADTPTCHAATRDSSRPQPTQGVLTTLLRRACSKRYAPQEHAPYNTRRATRSTSAVPNGSAATAERTERTPKRRSSCSIAAPVSSLCALEYCASYSAGRICTRDGPSFAALRQGWRKSNPNDGHSTPTAGLATIARKWNGLRARRLRRRYVLRARTWDLRTTRQSIEMRVLEVSFALVKCKSLFP